MAAVTSSINEKELSKLDSILATLSEQAQILDQDHSVTRARNQQGARFDHTLFRTQSSFLQPYIRETKQQLVKLRSMVASQHSDMTLALLTKIENQITALIHAIPSASKANEHNQKVQEYLQFERRLKQMIVNEERNLARVSGEESTHSLQTLVALRARLKRCQQAIQAL